MGLSDIVRRGEYLFNDLALQRKEASGWVPKITPYRGYGTEQRIRVIGRIVMHDPVFERTRPRTHVGSFAQEAQRGYRQFFTVVVGEHPVRVRVGNQLRETVTDSNGYFDISVFDHGFPPGWNTVEIDADNATPTTAEVLVTSADEKIGLISDIDDTVIVTNLPRATLAAYNSWVKKTNTRQPVRGMAKFYRELLADHPGAPVFYLSTGAWNTYDTLVDFLDTHGLPKGVLLLTDWGPTPTGLFRNGQEHKRVQLRNLLIDYPHIRWMLVGDNGQHDPLTYGDLIIEHRDAVLGVAIRELTPTEHFLSHGTTTALSLRTRTGRDGVPAISAPDGYSLLAEYKKQPFITKSPAN